MSVSNINNVYQLNTLRANKQKEVEKQNKQEQTKVETNQQENVKISKEAMDKLQNQKSDEIRQDKVDEMRKKIANGEFQVNANKIADKLLQQYKTTEAL